MFSFIYWIDMNCKPDRDVITLRKVKKEISLASMPNGRTIYNQSLFQVTELLELTNNPQTFVLIAFWEHKSGIILIILFNQRFISLFCTWIHCNLLKRRYYFIPATCQQCLEQNRLIKCFMKEGSSFYTTIIILINAKNSWTEYLYLHNHCFVAKTDD